LIELIELLIKDWYIAKHERKERLKQIVAVSEAKGTATSSGTPRLENKGHSR
jgi:hypothetical protein